MIVEVEESIYNSRGLYIFLDQNNESEGVDGGSNKGFLTTSNGCGFGWGSGSGDGNVNGDGRGYGVDDELGF